MIRLPYTLLLVVAGFTAAGSVHSYPDKPIRLIVPAAPGGATGTTAFMLRDGLQQRLRQPVVVDHRAGANGIIGTGIAISAPADGYTLLLATTSHVTLNPNLYANLPYVPSRDLAPVSMVSTFPLLLAVNPTIAAKTVGELIAFAKANPGRLNFGSSGLGNSNHLAGELLNAQAGINLTHIPYKSGGNLVIAAVSNEVSVMFGTPQTALPQARAGKLRLLAVTSAKRSLLFPDLPTVAESGVPGYSVDSWNGLFVPARTSSAVIARLNAEIVAILDLPPVRADMLKAGMEPVPTSSDDMKRVIQADTLRWAKLIREQGITINQ